MDTAPYSLRPSMASNIRTFLGVIKRTFTFSTHVPLNLHLLPFLILCACSMEPTSSPIPEDVSSSVSGELVSSDIERIHQGKLVVPYDPAQQLDDFSKFVLTDVLNFSPNRVCLLGYIMPTPALAYAARCMQKLDGNFVSLNASKIFPITLTSTSSALDETQQAALQEIISKCIGSKCLINLVFRGFTYDVCGKVSDIGVVPFQFNKPYGSYNITSGLTARDLSVALDVIYPADARAINKASYAPSVLIRETPKVFAEVHVPIMDDEVAKPYHLGWVYEILEEKKEANMLVYVDTDPANGFRLAVDTKWNCSQQALQLSSPIVNVAVNGRLSGTFTVVDHAIQHTALDKELIQSLSHTPVTEDPYQPPALPQDVATRLYMLALVNKRGIRSLRDLRAEHLPLLHNLRDGVLYVLSHKFHLAADQVVMYFHYAPTFYHLHLHVNHVSNYEMTHAGKCFFLDDVISNIEQDSDYYAKITLSFRLPCAHALAKAVTARLLAADEEIDIPAKRAKVDQT